MLHSEELSFIVGFILALIIVAVITMLFRIDFCNMSHRVDNIEDRVDLLEDKKEHHE